MRHVGHDRVLIRPHRAGQITAGGIVIPDQAEDAPAMGLALIVGAGVQDQVPVAPGDVVHFNRYAGSPVELVLEDTEPVRTCIACGIVEHDAVGDAKVCNEARDPATREPTFKHVWSEPKLERETLLVIHARDVALVESLNGNGA